MIVPELLSHKPVCLTLDWGADPRATFYSRPAPDTLTLLPNRGERVSTMEWTDVWGHIELAPSQQDRRGGGWVWWMVGDTLAIQGENPTMDGIAIWLVHKNGRSVATWKEFGLTSAENSPGGRVRLRPYECSGPAQAPDEPGHATGIVPAAAPDTVPSWVRVDPLIGPSAYIPVKFRRNILVVHFRREATQTQRQAAIDMISGTVVGGTNRNTGNGFYLIRVADPGDGSGLVRAAERLKGFPFVSSAGPDIEFGPNE